ncbi:MAG: hypothetical protein FWC93_01035 [Defluviitaleaceae bacterium]|nr:hypothetical protein [Defluviitaleaceae bacterium]
MSFGDDLRGIPEKEKQAAENAYASELERISYVKDDIITDFKVQCERAARHNGERKISHEAVCNYDVYATEHRDVAEKVAAEVRKDLEGAGFKKLDISLLYFNKTVSKYHPPSFLNKGGYKNTDVKFYKILIKAKW